MLENDALAYTAQIKNYRELPLSIKEKTNTAKGKKKTDKCIKET